MSKDECESSNSLYQERSRGPSQRTRQRWRVLFQALCNGRLVTESSSTRRFNSFGLIKKTKCERETAKDVGDGHDVFDWEIPVPESDRSLSILIRERNFDRSRLTPEELLSDDNTGNICVWPSEEVLAYFCSVSCPKELFVWEHS